jgi:hypothetical protein
MADLEHPALLNPPASIPARPPGRRRYRLRRTQSRLTLRSPPAPRGADLLIHSLILGARSGTYPQKNLKNSI